MEHKGHKDCATFCHAALSMILIPHHRSETIAVLFPTTDLLVFTQQTDYTHPVHVLFKSRLWNYKKIPHKMNIKKTSLPSRTTPNWSKLSKCGNFTGKPSNPGIPEAFRRDVQPWSWQVWMQLHQRPHCFAEDGNHNRVKRSSSHLFMRVFDHYQVDWWIDAGIYIYMYIQSIHSTVHVYRTYTWAEVTKKKL